MNYKSLKSISLLLFTGCILLFSCAKEKIVYDAVNAPDPVLLPDIPPECESCHKSTFPEHSTNAHIKHTTGLYAFVCSTCHYGHGWETSTHMNGVKNLTFNPNGMATRNGVDVNAPSYDSGTKQCSNVYCHSNGRTAFRGTDGTYTWSGSTGSQTATYTATPSWETGKITSCTFCHNGKGNMTSPYKVERPDSLVKSDYPASGMHQYATHISNNQDFSNAPYLTPYWGSVQCFWCHNTQIGDSTNVNEPNFQGTYGTTYHVDGQTFFKPLNVNAGGTMANGLSYSSNGAASHCGNGLSCW
ncbi:MAG: hypothetical protein A2046_11750 [Bacteroidetes bacterium GWA2_30_7]|nr:MAG: hypothetical protein A2046_11750 [Bacteroidetes bacterium GWA2_30_7]